MKIISTPRRMKLFWQLAKQWFTQQFETVASSIDFTEVEERIDDVKDDVADVKSDVADVKSAVENIDFSTLATEANATTNKQAILAKIGTPASGQATDLFAAIAEGGGGSEKLEEFFGVTLLQGYEFMQDTEVTDELEDIMQALDPELEQEVEYPEGSGTYMTKAQAITAEAMQIINPSQS